MTDLIRLHPDRLLILSIIHDVIVVGYEVGRVGESIEFRSPRTLDTEGNLRLGTAVRLLSVELRLALLPVVEGVAEFWL